MQYKAVTDVFLDNEVKPAGSLVDIKDEELAKGFLERGSITDADVQLPSQKTPFEAGQDFTAAQEEQHRLGSAPQQPAPSSETTGGSESTTPLAPTPAASDSSQGELQPTPALQEEKLRGQPTPDQVNQTLNAVLGPEQPAS